MRSLGKESSELDGFDEPGPRLLSVSFAVRIVGADECSPQLRSE
jgi:hypothetical protein